MPAEGPGKRFDAVATKATTHNAPVVELNHAGVAAKSEQVAPMVPNLANAAIAQQIAVGEDFVIMLDGVHTVASSVLPAGAAAGDQLVIRPSDNSLHKFANVAAGDVKFGVISAIDTNLGRAQINLSQRGSF